MISAQYNTTNKYAKHTKYFLRKTNYIPPGLITIDNFHITEHEWYYTMIQRQLHVFQFKDLAYNMQVSNNTPHIVLSPQNIYHGLYTSSDSFKNWNIIKFAISGFVSKTKIETLEDILTLKTDSFKYKTLVTDVPVSTTEIKVVLPLISLSPKYIFHLRSL